MNVNLEKERLEKQQQIDRRLESIFRKHFELDSDTHKDNPGYQAWAGYAVDVSVKVANIILSMKWPDSGRGFRALTDLTYQLNANDFWTKNAPVLVPVLTTVMNAHRDGMELMMERQVNKEYALYDKLISGSQTSCLEIFSMILFLVGGPTLMALSSLPLKLDLAPYVME